VGRLGDGDGTFYVGGGGGKSKTGVPNALDIFRLTYGSGECVAVPVHHHDMETGVVMNSATHPKRGNHLAVGVGGDCCALELVKKAETPKKESNKAKRRKKSKSDDEGSTTNSGQSHSVMVQSRAQTDFSDECYQKVVSFTCDGGRVVTGGSDGVVRVWEYPTLEKVCEFKGHENEIETLSCHPSKQQVTSMCRDGQAMVWDLTNQDREHSFNWSPGKQTRNTKPTHRFRASCFSPEVGDRDPSCLFTITIPIDRHKEKRCYLVKWDAGAWIVDEETRTGTELLSALAIDDSGRYVGVGTINGGILIYSSDMKLLSRVSGVHTVFVTGLAFLPLTTKPAVTSSGGKPVSKPGKLVLISVSADRTCSVTFVRRKSGTFKFIFLFLFLPLVFILVAMATKYW
jgi:prolactin regulatory element-binding protein